MRPLDDAFQIHKQSLLDAIEVCCSIPDEINKFNVIVSSLPAAMVKLRLTVVQGLIISGARALKLQHGDKGFVFVMASQNLLGVRWSEFDFLDGQNESLASGESIFIAPQAVLDKVEGLLKQVDSGELVSAIDWLSRYDNVYVVGLSCLSWTGHHKKKGAIENGPNVREEGERRHSAVVKSPVYVISVTRPRIKAHRTIRWYIEMLREFYRFLVSTWHDLLLVLKVLIIRIRPLFQRTLKGKTV